MGILATAPSTTGHKTNDSSSLLESPKVCRQTRSLSTISQGVVGDFWLSPTPWYLRLNTKVQIAQPFEVWLWKLVVKVQSPISTPAEAGPFSLQMTE